MADPTPDNPADAEPACAVAALEPTPEVLPPLCVDLDGTLIRSDALWESLFAMLGNKPQRLFKLPGWVSAGKATLKANVAAEVVPDAGRLPYRPDVLGFLVEQKAAGRTLVLATASHEAIAHAVADHLGLFDHVIATDDTTNRRGQAKVDAIRERVGDRFDYMGDSDADLPLVEASDTIHLVRPSAGLRRAAEAAGNVGRVFDDPGQTAGFKPYLKLIRPHQWAKNLLIFVPMLMGHRLDLGITLWTLLGFVAMCAAASSIYIFNDLVDIDSDRKHPSKRRRPLAAGTVGVPGALRLGVLLLLGGLIIAAVVGGRDPSFFLWVLLYLILTLAYSFSLKRKLLVDVIVLSSLYTHRVIAGGIIEDDVFPSPWLLAFSSFFFVSLAFAKRYTELAADLAHHRPTNTRRGYLPDDLPMIRNVGPTSGYMALLVFALYLNDTTAEELYDNPLLLWFVIPVLMYWITRVWFFAVRGKLDADPIVFAIRDRVSYACFVLVATLVILASA